MYFGGMSMDGGSVIVEREHPSWVFVIAVAGSEELAERGLRRFGYRTHLFRYRKVLYPHGTGRGYECTIRPLWNYVLVQDWRGWPHDERIQGTTGLLRVAKETARFSNGDFETWWRKEMLGVFDDPRPGIDTPAIGTKVESELVGERIAGEVVDLSGAGKAIVETAFFNRMVKTTIPTAKLRVSA
jgi:hypothetical protein